MNKNIIVRDAEETEDYKFQVKQIIFKKEDTTTIYIESDVIFKPVNVPYWPKELTSEDIEFLESLESNCEWNKLLEFTICHSQMTENVLLSNLDWLRIWKKLVNMKIIEMKKHWKILSI